MFPFPKFYKITVPARFRIAAGAIRVGQLGLAHFGRIPEMRRDRWEDGDGAMIRDVGWMGWMMDER